MGDDPFASIAAATAERNCAAGRGGDDWGASATAAAGSAYLRAERLSPAMAESAMVPISQLVRAAAAEVRMLIDLDPALPNLERRCWIHLMELNLLTAIFARNRGAEYAALCDSQKSLAAVASRGGVVDVWRILRGSERACPPVPRNPPTDDHEYYRLRSRC
jgi:hypothetical protein